MLWVTCVFGSKSTDSLMIILKKQSQKQ